MQSIFIIKNVAFLKCFLIHEDMLCPFAIIILKTNQEHFEEKEKKNTYIYVPLTRQQLNCTFMNNLNRYYCSAIGDIS